ncbi:hypothetical protein AB1Y20_006195 [Prymnesium parvum]|uniref:Uncharacterized protein n=1 Tax=Prymnesium parvum TaxID=97485 RepID=A0AB34J4I9_PRYPA
MTPTVRKPAADPPGFLAAFYQDILTPRPLPSANLARRPPSLSPRPLPAAESRQLSSRLDAALAPFSHLLPPRTPPPPLPPDAPHHTEGGLLLLHLQPYLAALRRPAVPPDAAAALLAVGFAEASRAACSRAPDLRPLLDALRDAACERAAAPRGEAAAAEARGAAGGGGVRRGSPRGSGEHALEPEARESTARLEPGMKLKGRSGRLRAHGSHKSCGSSRRLSVTSGGASVSFGASANDSAEEELEQLQLHKMYEDEQHAAVTLQRVARGMLSRSRILNMATRREKYHARRAAAIRLQAHARGKLARTAPVRTFQRTRAARLISRAWWLKWTRDERARLTALRVEGEALSVTEVARALEVRRQVASLGPREAAAVLPVLLAKRGDDIEKLKASAQLWADLPPRERAEAIATHIARAPPSERKQIVHSSVQVLSSQEIPVLLTFIMENAQSWQLTKAGLVHCVIASLPSEMASMTAHGLIESLLSVLPARAAPSVMHRLALFSHLPHIAKLMPEVEKPKGSRNLMAHGCGGVEAVARLPPPSHLYQSPRAPPASPTALPRSPRVNVTAASLDRAARRSLYS